MIALALCTTSCATGLREVQSVGKAIVDAKSFKAAETIVAPLYSELELMKKRLARLERKVRRLSRIPLQPKQPNNEIRAIKEPRVRSGLWK